jgi:Flp pilus assembly protein TadG
MISKSRFLSAASKQGGREEGQDTLEYALVLPLLLLLVFGIVDFGIVVFDYNTVANAAREGARAAILPPSDVCDLSCQDANALAAAQRLTTGLNAGELTISGPDRSVAGAVTMEVSYNVRLITGPVIAALGGVDTIPVRAVASMQTE